MMKSSIRPVVLAAALAAGGCGFSPHLPDSKELAAAQKAGKTYEAFAQALAEGDAAWARRAEGAEQVRRAISAWKTAYAVDANDRRVSQQLTLAIYYLGNYYTPDPKEREKVHLEGQDFGLAACRLNPDIRKAMDVDGSSLEEAIRDHAAPGDVPALYWMTVNQARAAELKGFATIAGMAPRVKGVMEVCYRLGPTYYWGGVHRFFGAYYTKAPAESDKAAKSKAEFEKAIAGDGAQNLENFVLYAEYYAKFVQDRDLYEKLLKRVVDTPAATDIEALKLDNAEARKRAKSMLEKIDEDF